MPGDDDHNEKKTKPDTYLHSCSHLLDVSVILQCIPSAAHQVSRVGLRT